MDNKILNDKLSNLLDSVYELEGLVQLAINKPGDLQNFMRLIQSKLNVVQSRVDDVDEVYFEVECESDVAFASNASNASDASDASNVDDASDADDASDVDDAESMTIDDINNDIVAALNGNASSLHSDLEIDNDLATDDEYDTDDELQDYYNDSETDITHTASFSQESEDSLNMSVASKNAGAPSNLFTINDKFRFTATLFHRNRKEMEDALKEVDRMNSFREVENYFYNILGWDETGDEVSDFMTTLSRWF